MTILRLDAGGRTIAERRLRPMNEIGYGVLVDMGIGSDGSILVRGVYYDNVYFGDGSGSDVLPGAPSGAGFAMKMAPDFSLIRVVQAPSGLRMMAPTPDGGLLAVDHRGVVFKGTAVDPYLFKLDGNLNFDWSVSAGNADTALFSLAVAGNTFEVAGFGIYGNPGPHLLRYQY